MVGVINLEYKKVMSERILQIRELKRKYKDYRDDKKVHILLTRYFQGDMSVIETIAIMYMPLIIESIERNFMNSNASIEELRKAGIKGVITAIKTLDISKKRYFCYELNLVMNNAERVNIVSHGNKKRMKADAQTLAEFLDIPLWDAIE
jgi:hypothetical protein